MFVLIETVFSLLAYTTGLPLHVFIWILDFFKLLDDPLLPGTERSNDDSLLIVLILTMTTVLFCAMNVNYQRVEVTHWMPRGDNVQGIFQTFKDILLGALFSRIAKKVKEYMFVYSAFMAVCMVFTPITLAFLGLSIVTKWLWKLMNFEPMKGVDVAMAIEDSISKPIISGILHLEGKPDINRIRSCFQHIVLAPDFPRYTKLKKYFCNRLGYLFWKQEESFDIRRHVYETRLKSEPESFEDDVKLFAESRIVDSFPEKVSPWEIIIVRSENEDLMESEFYAVIRVHHALSDGISLVYMLINTVADEPCTLPLAQKPLKPTLSLLFKFFRLLSYVKSILLYPAYLYKYFYFRSTTPMVAKHLNGQKISVVSEVINLAYVKDIKNVSGTSVNAVILSSLTASFRSFYEENRGRTDVPANFSFMMPFLLDMPKEDDGLQNCCLVGVQEFTTKKYSLTNRLQATQRNLQKIKNSPYLQLNTCWGARILSIIPLWFLDLFPRRSNVHAAFTNVPGPPEHISVWGHSLLDVFFLVPTKSNTGITISMLSYAGGVRIGILADTAVIESRDKLQTIMDEFMHQLQLLRELIPQG